MVQTDGILKATVYGGATTTYLFEIAPGVEVSVLEQNLHSAAHRGAVGRRRTGPHRLACRAQPRPADLNQELSQ